MNEEPTTGGSDTPEQSPAPQSSSELTLSSNPEPSPQNQKSGLSLPLLGALAVVPAVIVGLLVYLLAGNGGSDGGASTAVLDGFVRLSLAQGEEIESFADRLPPGYPDGMPVYDGAQLDASFSISSSDGTTYIATYSTSASKEEVFSFYNEKMDQEPWQVDLAREADDFTGLQFMRPDNADMQGSITISHSELDDRTAIFIFVLDMAQTSSGSSSDPVIPTTSRSLPAGFPSDVPIYKQQDGSVITETYFQRDSGLNSYLISFLTKDADVAVVDYYTDEFEKRGWKVEDAVGEPGDFALMIDFDDTKSTPEVQGTVRAEPYIEDSSYTQVSIIVQVSPTRGRN